MALDAAHRASIYEKLRPILGDHDANVLMSEFPGREADELVTKSFVRAEMSDLRAELAELKASLTVRLGTAIAASTAFISSVSLLA